MVIIRADGNKEIGMGHIMRCLSIACELRRHTEVMFVVSADTVTTALTSKGVKFIQIKSNHSEGVNVSEIIDIIKLYQVNSMLIDMYNVKRTDFDNLRKECKLFYIDDLCQFDYNVDGVINYNIEANTSMYFADNVLNRELFLGVSYLPLREELVESGISEIHSEIKEVLLTSGSTDPHHLLLSFAKNLSKQYSDITFTVLAGLFFEESYIKEIESITRLNRNIKILWWCDDVAAVFKMHDLVIAPGATTLYEAISLGVPCVSYAFVDNQQPECVSLSDMGIAAYAGYYAENTEDVNELFRAFEKMLDYNRRKVCVEQSLRLFDRKGTKRIADVLMQ